MQALKFSRRSFLKSGAAVAAASVLPGVSLPVQAAAAPLSAQVQTPYGPVQGTENDGVFCWYGVPYAAAPVGEARWTAPQEPSAWASPRDCSAPAAPAFQYASCALGSEDCLKLDLFAPADARSAPVLVYLHSGGNQTGSSGEVSGAEIARQLDCVFVGVEYRLGLLGWNCLPALCPAADDTGNFALLDMAKALDLGEREHRGLWRRWAERHPFRLFRRKPGCAGPAGKPLGRGPLSAGRRLLRAA